MMYRRTGRSQVTALFGRSRVTVRKRFLTLILASAVTAIGASALPASAIPLGGTDDEGVRTSGSAIVHGVPLPYTATAGKIAVSSADGRPRAHMFYVAYNVPARPGEPPRPVTFFFNGGPGSSTIWLHMGSYGPVRVLTTPPGHRQQGRYTLVKNDRTLLGVSDLVFIDAVGTGFSRPLDAKDDKAFLGIDEDADAFVQVISRYIADTHREASPKFLFGESYGTMRAAIVADRLHGRGIDMNGIVMLSSIFNFGHFASGLDQFTVDLLPSYAAVGWYHRQVDARGASLEDWVAQARTFAGGPYAYALEQGARLDAADRERTVAEMHRLTGLSADTVRSNNLRLSVATFRRELLRSTQEAIGYGDGRYKSRFAPTDGSTKLIDPAMAAVEPPYVAAFTDYARDTLHYVDDHPYVVNNEGAIMKLWDWAHQPPQAERQNALANSTLDLASALHKNPRLRLLMLNGYYDLTTPFFGTEFDLAHLPGQPVAAGRITSHYFPSGHMIYIDDDAHRRIGEYVAAFITAAPTP